MKHLSARMKKIYLIGYGACWAEYSKRSRRKNNAFYKESSLSLRDNIFYDSLVRLISKKIMAMNYLTIENKIANLVRYKYVLRNLVDYYWQREKEYYPDKQHNYDNTTDWEVVRDTYSYICDRWRCFMRAGWLLEVIENYEKDLIK